MFYITETDAIAVKRAKLLYIVPVNIALWPFLCLWRGYQQWGGPISVEGLRSSWCDPPRYFKCPECGKNYANGARGKILPFMCVNCETDEACT